jgi:hypothetical protein
MAQYMVERHLPGITEEQLAAAAGAAKKTTAEMARAGTPVRYLRSTFVPGENKCYCLFEGPDEKAVREANDRAELPYDRVVEARLLASEDLP